jgi:hypothetical protein
MPGCLVAQQLRQYEDYKLRKYLALGIVGVRLIHQRRAVRGGRVGDGGLGAYVDTIPRRMQKHCGGDVQREDEDCC